MNFAAHQRRQRFDSTRHPRNPFQNLPSTRILRVGIVRVGSKQPPAPTDNLPRSSQSFIARPAIAAMPDSETVLRACVSPHRRTTNRFANTHQYLARQPQAPGQCGNESLSGNARDLDGLRVQPRPGGRAAQSPVDARCPNSVEPTHRPPTAANTFLPPKHSYAHGPPDER